MQLKHTLFFCLLFMVCFAKAQISISGVINKYAKVDSIDFCSNTVYADVSGEFAAGDRILIIQMKGASADLSNTSAFGNILNYNNAGNYEFNTIENISGSAIELENNILRQYTISGSVQIVKVGVYSDATVDASLSAAAWNGSTGGVLVLEADNLSLNADIDVSEKGFRAGNAGNFPESCPSGLGSSLYYTDTLSGKGAEKGEGIIALATAYLAGKGKAINGGGGGNDHNGGAGGGSNGAAGGKGGKNDESLFSCPGDGAVAAVALDQSLVSDRIYAGGGGGAGHGNNHHASDGGNGGGIVIIRVNNIAGNGYSIISNGGSVTDLAYGDGAGGGGAGGSIILVAGSVTDLNVIAKGGKGGDTGADQCTGPGGGGSGGVLKYSAASLWPGVTVNLTGGVCGTNTWTTSECYGLANGALGGGNGVSIPNMTPAESNLPFSTEFANAGNDTTVCSSSAFYLHASGGASYSWAPSDLLTDAVIADALVPDAEAGIFTVLVTDIHGCTDTDSVEIHTLPAPDASAGNDTLACSGSAVMLHASGGLYYNWSPVDFLNATDIPDPISVAPVDMEYIVEVINAYGCSDQDTVLISRLPADFAFAGNDTLVCSGAEVPLHASGGVFYNWYPADLLSDADIADPISTATESIEYIVTVTNMEGCMDADTIQIEVLPADFAFAGNDTSICPGSMASLHASGGDVYSWSPALYLSDALISDPVSSATESITYTVSVSNSAGCADTDEITVEVYSPVNAVASPDTALCGGGQIYLHAEGGDIYQWSPSEGLYYDFYADPLAIIDETITYTVLVTDAVTGCSDTASVNIVLLPEPEVETNEDTTICKGSSLVLSAAGALSYAWQPAAGIPCPECEEITVTPEETTLYTVIGTNAEGCADVDSVLVTVEICNSIEDGAQTFSLYPNPAENFVFIQHAFANEEVQVEVQDINGVRLSVPVQYLNNNTIHLDMQNLPSQIVFILLKTKDNTQMQKVIVQ